MDIVKGYFTIGALAWLSRQVNGRVSEFRPIPGDIVNTSFADDRALELLNGNICFETSFRQSSVVREIIDLLKQKNVASDEKFQLKNFDLIAWFSVSK